MPDSHALPRFDAPLVAANPANLRRRRLRRVGASLATAGLFALATAAIGQPADPVPRFTPEMPGAPGQPGADEGEELLTAGELLSACEADQAGTDGGRLCRSFIAGFVQTVFALQGQPEAEQTICLDIQETSFEAVRDGVVDYIAKAGPRGGEPAFQLTGEFIQRNYACPGATGS